MDPKATEDCRPELIVRRISYWDKINRGVQTKLIVALFEHSSLCVRESVVITLMAGFL